MQKIQVGTNVEWTWGRSRAQGKVTRTFTADVTRKIKGKTISRKADRDKPAFLIEQEDGDRVLKSQSEIRRAHG
ncbi:DUF2945 domain-containing protein [Neorhizobium sp. NCHU2750]|uniref:DUF2945 domain-containing protein n=1 Tax=Neorhizobium sp. NCHU2750 TaxID=1825976 RepID=UPI000E761B76|nr:hypothetical protein NCHU2750_26870 [Neorhizobium sp. NCHU2750]